MVTIINFVNKIRFGGKPISTSRGQAVQVFIAFALKLVN